MANLNRVILMGNLTMDPETRRIQSGSDVVTLNMAINRKYKKDNDWVEEVDYIRVTVFGKQAEACAQYLSKGKPVFVEGRLKLNQWETDQGEKRSTLDVVATNVQFLGGKDQGQDSHRPAQQYQAHPQTHQTQQPAPSQEYSNNIDYSDVPF